MITPRRQPSIPIVVTALLAAGALQACSDGGDASGDPVLELLARPHVQEALAAAAAAGYPITTETKPEPPALTGYYVKPFGEGRFVASGNGANLTSGVLGNEFRVAVNSDGSVTEASVSFDQVAPVGSIVTSGLLLRGADDRFTLYDSYTLPCPVAGTDRAVEMVSILSGRFAATTGDWESMRQIIIAVAASGAYTSDCDPRYAGDTELPGGWIVSETALRRRIGVADLQFMCVDEGAGYVAGESWTRADTTACSCSTDFVVVCQ
jgi:hypothetical protein